MHPLKLYIMSSFLNSIGSNIQSLANGAFSSLIGGKISSGISKDMMRYQDKLNDQNALDAYNRQRALMGDAALLQKQGMLKAGYNTAFGSNGSVMNAGTPSSSNVGLGSAESNKMPNSFQTLLDAKNSESSTKVADAQSGLLRSQQQSQDIKNAFEIDRQIEEVEKLHKENKISDAEYQMRMENLKRALDTHDAYVTEQQEHAKQSEIQTRITDIQRQQEEVKTQILSITKDMNSEQLKQLQFITEHQFERFVNDMEEQSSRIAANKASAAASYASAAASRAQAMYTATLNKLEAAKVPYADKLARAISDQARNAATLTFNQAIGAGLDNAPKAREAQYQNYIKGQENSFIGRHIFYNIRGVFENSVGNILHFGK
uniref:Uncharacterized protein n=1 Tax=Microviridae sp. ctb4Q28 TaxID=2825002 RepID=A0A8S5UXN9_9VIRU|nr:MAG TPA: hypothetical protein [Microviridae sp. ctb4Q28]